MLLFLSFILSLSTSVSTAKHKIIITTKEFFYIRFSNKTSTIV